MENWNYTSAKQFADGITDTTTRRLTQFFLNHFSMLAFQKYAVPENSEFDLLCFVKIIEKIVSKHGLIKRCIEGENLDAGWEALADVLETHLPLSPPVGIAP